MARHHLLFALTGGLGIALACGSGSSDLVSRKSYDRVNIGDAAGYGSLDQAYILPPSRAIFRIDVSVATESAESAASELRTQLAAVTTAVSAACEPSLLDYSLPSRGGWSKWRASAEVRVDLPLHSLSTIEERMDAVDSCMAAIRTVDTGGEGVDLSTDKRRSYVGTSGVLELFVDDPAQHAPELLRRRSARLAAVADDAGAPQLAPEDLRCTPSGEVIYGARRLSGVELILGMNCRVLDPTVEIEVSEEAPPVL